MASCPKSWEIVPMTLPNGQRLLRLVWGRTSMSLEGLQQMHEALQRVDPTVQAVLLESWDVTLPRLAPPQEQAWLLLAGTYRQAQEAFKASGGRLLSLVRERLVGGPYLIHGAGASVRLALPEVQVYPALSPEPYQQLTKQPYPHSNTPQAALLAGVITAIIPHEPRDTEWLNWISSLTP